MAGGVLYKHGPMRFSLIDKYIGKQWFTSGENVNYQSNGYNTAILSARYDIGPVRIGVEVNNIFDSKAVTNVSTGKTALFDQYFYQTGRAYTGDITLTF